MIRGILFDLDNTLFNFNNLKTEAARGAAYAMVDAGLSMEKDEAASELLSFYWREGIDSDNIFEKFLERNMGEINFMILDAGIRAYLEIKMRLLRPFPSVPTTLNWLNKQGYKMAIVTDAPRNKAIHRLVVMDLLKYFGYVVAFDDTGKIKPHKKPFQKALDYLQLDPHETLMVGDWMERDIVGARSLGMKTAFASYGSQENHLKGTADFNLHEFNGLMNLLRW